MKKITLIGLLGAVVSGARVCAGFDEPTVMNQPYTQMVQDPNFGDYEGTYTPSAMSVADGGPATVAAEAKVIAEGNRQYRVILRARPLDPQEWPLQIELNGHMDGDRIRVEGHAGGHDWDGQIDGQKLTVNKHGYGGAFEMKHVMKKSPTEGLPPPIDAIILLAYKPGQKPTLDEWKEGSGWVVTDDGILHKGPGSSERPNQPRHDLYTKREFHNFRLHLELRLPYEPELHEQMRGNSGVFMIDRYEVQVLDSYGLVEGAGDCASIYDVAPAKINAAFPPLSWQTYDIIFYAPKMDGGKMVRGPSITVEWNGVKVHDNQTAPTPTGDPGRPNAASGPLRLQDHGSLDYYRNIWLEELPDKE